MTPARQEWFSAAELAGLPGLSPLPQNVRRRAETESWQSREEPGRGTPRKLYSIDSLPPEARAELDRRAAEEEARLAYRLGIAQGAEHYRQIRDEQLQRARDVQPHERRRAEARAAILRARDIFREAAMPEASKDAANEAFARAYTAGRITVDTGGLALGHVSARTLWRWERQASAGSDLTAAYGNRAGQCVIDEHPEWVRDILGALAEKPHLHVKTLIKLLRARYGRESMVTDRTLAKWIERWKARNRGLWADWTNPDAARGRYMPALGSRSEQVRRLNQLWELDSSPTDLMLGDGKRYTLISALDVCSRRCRMVLAESSTARDVGQVLRRAIIDWGVPEAVLTDNGKDYVSHYTDGFLCAAGIEHRLTPPYRGDHKPHVERMFRTVQHDLVELLPGYCGHSVADAQAIRSRKSFARRLGASDAELFEVRLTPEEFTAKLDEWLVCDYELRPHDGLGGQTPRAMAEQWTGEVRRISDERALDVLLTPLAKTRTVAKKGLRVEGAWFIAGELGPLVGREVQVRVDPSDIGRVWVFSLDGGYICTAECPERTGVSRAEIAARARAIYQERLRQGRAELRAAKREAAVQAMDEEIAAYNRREAAKVLPIRVPEELVEPHTTPALEGAEDLIAASEVAPAPRTVPESVVAEGRAAIRRFDAEREARRIEEEQRAREDQAAIDRWIGLAATPREERSERDQAWFERMAGRDPIIRDHVRRRRPDLAPLIDLAAEGLA